MASDTPATLSNPRPKRRHLSALALALIGDVIATAAFGIALTSTSNTAQSAVNRQRHDSESFCQFFDSMDKTLGNLIAKAPAAERVGFKLAFGGLQATAHRAAHSPACKGVRLDG